MRKAGYAHAIHRHWRFFNTTRYIKEYFPVLQKYLVYRTLEIDARTGLFRSTHGLGDVCIDKAVRRSTALIRVNGECMRLFARCGEMARAIGRRDEARKYEEVAQRIRQGINKHLWNEDGNRYEVKIFTNVTANPHSLMHGVKEDHRFFVAGNMSLVYFGVPDTNAKITSLMAEIEKADGGLKLYGQSVEPPYPDGSYSGIFNGGRYWNGDVWPSFASWYSIALFRLGYPAQATEVLRRQAEVAIRDGCFREYYEDDAEGQGKGASHYGFTAAPYVRTLVEGLFGLDADYPGGTVAIHPSLAGPGSLCCQLGLHPFDVKLEVDNHTRQLSVDTTYEGPTDFRVLIDRGGTACRVTRLPGAELPCSVKKLGSATYAFFKDTVRPGTTTYRLILNQP